MRTWLALVLLLIPLAAVAQTPPLLPPDVSITAPGSDVPPELAAFSGKWVGDWQGFLDSILVVEKISGRTASLVYSWGVWPAWHIRQPGFSRVQGTIDGEGVLRAELGLYAKITYRLSPDRQSLAGEYINRYMTTPVTGTFKKQP